MRALRRRVFAYDVHRWANAFLEELGRADGADMATPEPSPPEAIAEVIETARAAPNVVFLLDYDGTLVPFADTPELAIPDEELLALLRELAETPGYQLHIVSGRQRATLEEWLGGLPIGLHAEHGLWSRMPPFAEWVMHAVPSPTWMEAAREILRNWTERTPGSLTEEKTAGLAWHYRMADPELGAARANELQVHLSAVLANEPVELLAGNRVLELRPHGVHKGRVVEGILATAPPDPLVLAIGDDHTDEDLFAALPQKGISIIVGSRPSRAQVRVPGILDVRALLTQLRKTSG